MSSAADANEQVEALKAEVERLQVRVSGPAWRCAATRPTLRDGPPPAPRRFARRELRMRPAAMYEGSVLPTDLRMEIRLRRGLGRGSSGP